MVLGEHADLDAQTRLEHSALARYFKYKTPADLARDAAERGLDIRLTDDLEALTMPIEVAGHRVGNRLAIQPMEGCDATPDGTPDELTLRRYQRFGAGGAKLIWGEAAAVVPEGRANPRQLVVDESHTEGLRELADVCRAAHREAWGTTGDLLVGLQLTHSGRYSVPRPILAQHDPLLDPRIVDRSTGQPIKKDYPLISDSELDRLQDRYVQAARVAFRVGFDFIDIKQCHRYLLCELLSSRTRPGKYGGSFENRTRFIREVVARIRDEVPGSLIGTRMNVYDGIPYVRGGPDGEGVPSPFETPVLSVWGTRLGDPLVPDLAEPLALVGHLQRLGVALLNVSMGNPYGNMHVIRPFEYAPVDGYETPEHPLVGVDRHFRLTAEIQRAYPGLAVVGSGYSWLQAYMFHAGAANLRAGRVSFVGVGRGALSHPDFAAHVMAGQPLDPKRTCRTFSYCTALMRSKHHPLGQFPTGCPPFDKEVYGPIWKDAQQAAASSSSS
ncbi:MAG TPA: NADH:flavin oxidoreductase [Isosphaeraceae bacterium]|jgi:2,4-dienoyl-CoA reductase-like NADH-dependent reductase (Old Yellow Enzyme family)|nr:NADH:flavin oxidoreductase [Isosphaeraceae bacterium]